MTQAAMPPVIDGCVHVDWTTQKEVVEYLPDGWKEYIGSSEGQPLGLSARPIAPVNPFHDPDGDVIPGSSATGFPGPTGVTESAAAAADRGVAAAVLCPSNGLYVPSDNNAFLSLAVTAAVNDWLIDRWLGEDTPHWGSILTPNHLPEQAAAEIRRVGAHPRMAQVLLSGNALGKPLGHPIYHPIYEAAAELGLPIAIHIGLDAPPDTPSYVTAGGPPATYSEYRVLGAQALMTHVVSIMGQGVLTRFPDLRFLLIGGGIGWIPWSLWRDDMLLSAWGRDIPWLDRRPSELFRERFRVSTHQLELRTPRFLEKTIESYEGFGEILCFASAYPDRESFGPDDLERVLPAGWTERIVHDTPLELYGSRIDLESPAIPLTKES